MLFLKILLGILFILVIVNVSIFLIISSNLSSYVYFPSHFSDFSIHFSVSFTFLSKKIMLTKLIIILSLKVYFLKGNV